MLAAVAPAPLAGDELFPTGRYTQARAGATADQLNLLSAMVTVRFGSQVQTVGEALEVLLGGSGYRVKRTEVDGALFDRTLPAVHRTMGPLALDEAVGVLAGEAWTVRRDPLLRTLAFTLAGPHAERRPGLLLDALHRQPPPLAVFIGFDRGRAWLPSSDGLALLGRVIDALNAGGRPVAVIAVTGHSVSRRQAAKYDLAARRGEVVATRLRQALPRAVAARLVIDPPVVLNGQAQDQTGAAVVITWAVTPDAPVLPAPLSSCELVTVHAGSLKANVERLMAHCGLTLGEWGFGGRAYVADWVVKQPYSVVVEDGVGGVLQMLRDNYLIDGVVRPQDQTIDFYPGGAGDVPAPTMREE